MARQVGILFHSLYNHTHTSVNVYLIRQRKHEDKEEFVQIIIILNESSCCSAFLKTFVHIFYLIYPTISQVHEISSYTLSFFK